jgi:hypothetical protein
MVEEIQSQNPVLSPHATEPGEHPAAPVTAGISRSNRNRILAAGVIVLIIIAGIAIALAGIVDFSPDPVTGTWTMASANFEVQCAADGTTLIRYADTGTTATGRWEKVAENQYQLISANGSKSPILVYDPIADALHTADYSFIMTRKG